MDGQVAALNRQLKDLGRTAKENRDSLGGAPSHADLEQVSVHCLLLIVHHVLLLFCFIKFFVQGNTSLHTYAIMSHYIIFSFLPYLHLLSL